MMSDADLETAAKRASKDPVKRRIALLGLLLVLPTLMVGATLWGTSAAETAGWHRPVRTIAEPLVQAWREDRDLALIGYLALQLVLLAAVGALPGGTLHRLMAVEIATGAREPPQAGWRFALRHWGAYAFSAFLCRAVFLLPVVGLAVVAAASGPLVLVLLFFALLFLLLAVRLLAGLHPWPAISADGFGAGPAWGRTLRLYRASLSRSIASRFAVLGVIVPASLRRLLALGLTGFAVFGLVRLVAGAECVRNALAVIQAMGMPADAERLGVHGGQVALAALLALGAVVLLLAWLSDLVCRLTAARTARYLSLRHATLSIDPAHLEPPAERPAPLPAEAAGFLEIGRLG